MIQLGVSLYPEQETSEQIDNYLKMANSYGFTKIFTSLFSVEGSNEEIIRYFKDLCDVAHKYGMQVYGDCNARFFNLIGAKPDDLSVFKQMGLDVLRLDLMFDDERDVQIVNNDQGLGIQLNASTIPAVERILENGGAVISEYLPGVKPVPGNFPARNRIISGMTQGTLLVEGAEKSGAMITVNDALDQNRDVFAVPGSIYSSLSYAPNKLIVNGAYPVLSGWDILEHYRWAERPDAANAAPRNKIELDPEDDQIVRPLLEQELSFDELANIVDFPIAKLNSHLTMLELRGIIVKVPGGLYRAYL